MAQHTLVWVSGHSSGLGKALAEHYIAEACSVIGISRRQWPAADGLAGQAALDLSDSAALAAYLDGSVFQTACRRAQRIILFNNAATLAPNRLSGRQGWRETAAAVALNIAAPLMLADAVAAFADGIRQIDIVHISSGAGRKAYAGWSVYGACKAALDRHALVLAEERLPNVRIASLAPGVVDTGMQAHIRNSDAADFPLLPQFQALHEQGVLMSAQETAARIAAFVESPEFGKTLTADVRDYMNG